MKTFIITTFLLFTALCSFSQNTNNNGVQNDQLKMQKAMQKMHSDTDSIKVKAPEKKAEKSFDKSILEEESPVKSEPVPGAEIIAEPPSQPINTNNTKSTQDIKPAKDDHKDKPKPKKE